MSDNVKIWRINHSQGEISKVEEINSSETAKDKESIKTSNSWISTVNPLTGEGSESNSE